MFFPEGHVKVFVYGKPTDMRKSFHGLHGLVKHVLGEDPLSGHLFVFINRRGNFIKVYYFDRSGYCIWSKRLEQGRFHWKAQEKTQMQWTDLKLLLEGIEPSVKRLKRYDHTQEKRCVAAQKTL
jgi:transposase